MTGGRAVLLTGATGYVGGRLLPELERAGHRVRCLARRPEYLQARAASGTEIVAGDVLDPTTLREALRGIEVAYYLVHSMGSAGGFEEEDRRGARHFAEAALEAGVRRIVYLGGLGGSDELSAHLKSRHEVGRILRESGVDTVEFRASVIIGSGSLSFAMARALVDKLPVMVTPRWVRVLSQPISIEDVLAYLVAAAETEIGESRVFEIGGADRVSYLGIMEEYARQRGLRRWILPVPFLSLQLSSLWLGLVTPVYARVGRKLIESARNETVVRDDAALRAFSIRPRGIRESIERALINEDQRLARTRWSDALSAHGRPRTWGGVDFGSRLVESRAERVPVSPERAFRPIRRIGGETGWYYGNFLWKLRGFLDLMVGGAGLRRGRRDPDLLAPGDTVDFWRVEAYEPDRLLRLSAEMRVPGRAWLQFEVRQDPDSPQGSAIHQTAIFDPVGLSGRLYWYALYPLHAVIFSRMLQAIAREAVRGDA
jgi:uncharacterized protein YbjT (DUF2867 family)